MHNFLKSFIFIHWNRLQNPPHSPKYCGHALTVLNSTVLLSHAPTIFIADGCKFKPCSCFQGFMEFSYLFYGYYNNTMVEDYNIPLAYLFTAVFYFIFCFICIITRSVPALILLLFVKIKHVYVCVFSRFSDISGQQAIARMTFRSLSREFSHLDLHLGSLPCSRTAWGPQLMWLWQRAAVLWATTA